MGESRESTVKDLLETVRKVCGAAIIEGTIAHGDVVVETSPEQLFSTLQSCKESPELAFQLLVDVTAVDWMDSRSKRFEVVYQLLSLSKTWRLTVKVAVPEDKPELQSATPLWKGANFLEREVWDMFGISFKGHPDLRRILMYDEFVGHPLRKDYPVQGKQPRIALRHPEVENTARRMHRGDLVTIRSRRRDQSSGAEGQGI